MNNERCSSFPRSRVVVYVLGRCCIKRMGKDIIFMNYSILTPN